MKRAGGGKAKGSAFERQACKDLSLWVTAGQRDDCLWRSAMSGGRATLNAKKGKNLIAHVSGDICATHPDGHPLIELFYIECKFYKDLKLAQLVTSTGGPVAKFWEVAREQAAIHHKLPMLILKQNMLPAILGISRAAESRLTPSVYGCTGLAVIPSIGLSLYDYHAFLSAVPLKPVQMAVITRRSLVP